ncbi:serine acetyltransferase 1, chloroplastic-like [Andrographis paniculata]|uniref:serine acetyltransferase 1, chloroplastic-like n=1 Tax=Andrographis paniculata TaxID=175694 RepID=UPI0021E6F0E2|nr:serine acetyltransferase 1, chloroplastic-like [Andrographis paniculata]
MSTLINPSSNLHKVSSMADCLCLPANNNSTGRRVVTATNLPGQYLCTTAAGNQEFDDHLWFKIRIEAVCDAVQEPILKNFYNSAVLSHRSLESALANQLAGKLCSPNLSGEALYEVFCKTLIEDEDIRRSIRNDLTAVRERDPACLSYVHCLLNFKGFLACQAHRAAHRLWAQGRAALAVVIQSRVSEVFAIDIHPAARIGSGVVFDHGTGVVIGETAVVGDDVTILHGVTLGGTGKVGGDRHPKIGNGVLIGAGTKVLGNVKVGENAKIGAGSVVLKEIPAGATAVGNPARLLD